jgi:hypothetical protein
MKKRKRKKNCHTIILLLLMGASTSRQPQGPHSYKYGLETSTKLLERILHKESLIAAFTIQCISGLSLYNTLRISGVMVMFSSFSIF